jgi:hypothetical protein
MAVIGFDPVIAVVPGPVATKRSQLPVRLQVSNRRRIAAQSIPGEYLWRPIVGIVQGTS